ncbi:MAG: ABC transporter substrate-binding protein [Burkholderiaceae bacterium]|nr:ABC transporter substrate-binding protein [Burkholderiaceae bacterium]
MSFVTRPDPIPSAELLQQLAPSGRLRAAINYGNPVLAQKDAASGEPRGVSVDLAYAVGQQLGLAVELVGYDIAGKVLEGVAEQAWDVAFLAIDPQRATQISFTSPYVLIEGGYLVPNNSPFLMPSELDRAGVRIAVGKGAAYDLYLSRSLKDAQLVRAPTSAAAIELFVSEGLDAAAGVKQPLQAYAASHRNVRVLEGRFMAIEQAVALPAGRPLALQYLQSFIEQHKASGFVADALARSGQGDVTVAPAQR